nr:hypothetical protein [uncultured Flavobacterium sp.]
MEDKALTSILNIINYDEGEIILFDYSAYDIYCKYETLFQELKKEIQSNLLIIKEDRINYLNSFNKKLFNNYSLDKFKKSKHFEKINPLSGEITIDASLYSILKIELCLSGYNDEYDEIYSEQYEFIEFVKNYFLKDLYSFTKDLKKKIAKGVNVKEVISTNTNLDFHIIKNIKWIGKPSQLGFIIGKLADLGYIEAPKKINGETNFTQFAKQVNNTFEIETKESTLSKYLNLETEKAQETFRKFNENGFDIPHIKTVS